jgi:hypothetical protein
MNRSRSANRYSVLEEEEEVNQPSPDLINQIDTEGDLERELNTLNLVNVSVHSEYQQKPKSPQKLQSPKSLHNSKAPLAI